MAGLRGRERERAEVASVAGMINLFTRKVTAQAISGHFRPA
jgi:hypothetical protein